ncbi:LysR family transcriptional regulator [Nocardia seriolae]|uniref:LysR family transcriptional regulator n=1 Tax=Nocardia seriolae TaxID=37332 RepID=UPI00051A2477|nr:LysR family transcriptional regulator [Nocardia seriolae]MTJ62019.1 LysR family transcriptional regulator [Nocardia seriolae]MTJ71104.1 LysR family transcriptional regulator [Nocardia seriolae]MTJ89955.1 LysR family transcriptional regulator [Nocardia seriolae]MTK33929.1 LysR family transcriptional regulator [Nocardia seriolae]MTK39970.1 LysR family transcriptional regulator [Nocardia seriolae]
MIDPRLQALRVLHERGTVTAAAAALHLTPSTVSQQLRGLARELDVELLEQVGRRVQLTAAGHALLRHADLRAAQADSARAELAAHRAGIAGVVRIGAMSTALTAFVAAAAARLRNANPGLTVELIEDESFQCFEALLVGDCDIGIVLPAPGCPAPDDLRFEQHPLLAEPVDLLVPVGHPLAGRESVALSEAAAEPWITGRERITHRLVVAAACAAAGFTPRIAGEAIHFPGVAAMVAHGFGVSLVARLAFLPPDLPVVRVPLHGDPIPIRRHLTAVRRGCTEHPVIAAGLQAIREICRERTDITVLDA